MNRRNIISSIGGVAALPVVLSGCLDDESESSDQETDEDGDDALFTETGNYDSIEQWLVAPGQIDADHYAVDTYAVSLLADQPDVDDDLADSFDETFSEGPLSPVAIDTVDQLIPLDDQAVVLGDLDVATIGAELETVGFESAGSYEGYDIYTDTDYAIGVTDDSLVASLDGADRVAPIEMIELLVDTRRGSIDGYTDERDSLRRVTDRLTAADRTRITTLPADLDSRFFGGDDPAPTVAIGEAAHHEDGDTEGRTVVVFADADSVDEGTLEDSLATIADHDGWSEYTVDLDGAVLTAEWTASTAAWYEGANERDIGPVDTEVTVTIDEDSQIVGTEDAPVEVEMEVISSSGEPVTDATVLLTAGSALLEGVHDAETGDGHGLADNEVRFELAADDYSLRPDQDLGSIEIEVVPPSDSSYVDEQPNPEVQVINGEI